MSGPKPDQNTDGRRSWEKPQLKQRGTLSELLQFPGGGKLSIDTDDTGDLPKKPKGQEGF